MKESLTFFLCASNLYYLDRYVNGCIYFYICRSVYKLSVIFSEVWKFSFVYIFFPSLVLQCTVLYLLIGLDFGFYLTIMSVLENFARKSALIYSSLLIFRLISVFLQREGFLRVLEQSNTRPRQRSFEQFFLKDWIYSVVVLKRLMFSCEVDNRARNDRKWKELNIS